MSGMLGSTVGKVMWMRRAGSLTFALVVMVAMVLAAGVLALVGTAKPAEAAFPGANGKIAFSSNRVTGDGVNNPTADNEIFTMNADGTGVTQLTENTGNDEQPAWSPDGTKIAFRSERDGNYEIFTMKSDGTGRTNISNTAAAKDNNDNDAEDIDPDWQPIPQP